MDQFRLSTKSQYRKNELEGNTHMRMYGKKKTSAKKSKKASYSGKKSGKRKK